MATKSNIKGARVEMFIDGAAAPMEATISVSAMNQLLPIVSARYGATPVGYLVEGNPAVIACEFLEHAAALLKQALGTLADGLAIVPGSQMPSHVVRLHNPADGASNAADIVIPAAV